MIAFCTNEFTEMLNCPTCGVSCYRVTNAECSIDAITKTKLKAKLNKITYKKYLIPQKFPKPRKHVKGKRVILLVWVPLTLSWSIPILFLFFLWRHLHSKSDPSFFLFYFFPTIIPCSSVYPTNTTPSLQVSQNTHN